MLLLAAVDRPDLPDIVSLLALLIPLLGFALGLVTIVGAIKMMRLRSYRWSLTASILSLMPCGPVGLLGLVMGIWSLIVLNRRAVRRAFEVAAKGQPVAATPMSRSQGTPDERPVQAARSKAITILGVANILIAAFWGLQFAFDVFMPEVSKRGFPQSAQDNRVFHIWMTVSPPLHFVATDVLLVAGVGLLLVKRWARTASLGYAIFKIAMFLVEVPLYMMFLIVPSVTEASAKSPDSASEAVVGFVISLPIIFCFELFYPILLLVILQKANVKAAFVAQARSPESGRPSPAAASSASLGLDAAKDAPGVDEEILAQLALPGSALAAAGALGLGITVNFISAALPYLWNDPRIPVGLGALTAMGVTMLPFSWLFVMAGINLRRCQRYNLASHASLAAAIPIHFGWPVGLPAGIWAMRVLTQAHIKAAFRERAAQGPPKPLWRKGLLFAIVMILTALALLPVHDRMLRHRWPGGSPKVPVVDRPSSTMPAATVKAMQDAPKEPPGSGPVEHQLFYTFAGLTPFVTSADGPKLGEPFIAERGFTSLQVEALNKIVQSYYREFVSLERQHTIFKTGDDGRVQITISPFRDQTMALAERMVAEARGVIGEDLFHPELPGSLEAFGLFRHAGATTVSAQLWKEGDTYHFHEEHAGFEREGMKHDGASRSDEGKDWKRAFPEEYWLYWKEPVNGG